MVAKGKSKKALIRRIRVNLGKRSYPILIGSGILNQIGSELAKLPIGKKIGIITNPTVGQYYAPPVKSALEQAGFHPYLYSIPDGESYKNLDIVRDLYYRLIDDEFDRTGSILALGGGVIGDLAGFIAATYLRGIPFIQVPTTLLAQVDSSVGGKVGVNLAVGKNLIGSFYQPKLVIIDPDVLKTLPARELRAGLAEVVKYGIIYDISFFNYLEKNIDHILNLERAYITDIIARSCEIKAMVVSQDETEQGLRAILNYGHTLGHAIETLTKYEQYRHGEAVAIGMVAAGKLGVNLSLFNAKNLRRLTALLTQIGLPTSIPDLDLSRFLDTIYRDKKVQNRTLRMVIPTKIGQVKLVKDISIAILQKTIKSLIRKK